MNRNLTTLLVALVAAVALVTISYLMLHNGGGILEAQGPGGTKLTVEGKGHTVSQPGSISGQDLSAGGNIEATAKTGGDVEISRGKADGDIKLSTEGSSGSADPK